MRRIKVVDAGYGEVQATPGTGSVVTHLTVAAIELIGPLTGRHLVRALLRLFVGAVSANQAAGCSAEDSVVSGHMACRAAHDGALEAALCLRRSAAGNHH